MQIIVCTIVEIIILGIFMYYLTKHEEKTFIKELQKLTITVDLKPILDKIELIKPCDFSEVIDEIHKINIPEVDLKPVLDAINKLENKIHSGEVEIVDGIIKGNLFVEGNISSKGNMTAFCEEE